MIEIIIHDEDESPAYNEFVNVSIEKLRPYIWLIDEHAIMGGITCIQRS